MFQTTSTERRAAGGDRPRSGGTVQMRPLRTSLSCWSNPNALAQRVNGTSLGWVVGDKGPMDSTDGARKTFVLSSNSFGCNG